MPILGIKAYISPNGNTLCIFVDFAKELRLPDIDTNIYDVLIEDQTPQWRNSELGLANSGHLRSAKGFVIGSK